jgi:putative peptidoglycan lipid II flippase
LSSVARATFTVLVINLISRVLGFVRDAVIAKEFGASGATDAYLVAYQLPYSLQAILGMAFVTVVVPVVTGYLLKGEEDEGWKVVSSLINGTFLVLAILTGLGIILAPQLVRLMAPGFDEVTAALTAKLSRIMFPSIIFMGLGMLLTGILNAGKIFAMPAFAPAFANIVIILTVVFFGGEYRIQGLAVGTLAGFIGFFLIQLPSLAKLKFRYYLKLDYKEPVVRSMALSVLPVCMSIAVNQILLALNRFFASNLASGSITALDYADRLMNLPLGIFVAAISTAIFPLMAEEAVRKDKERFAGTINKGLGTVTVAMLPAAAGLILLRVPLVELLFERGAFDHSATLMTAEALAYFSLGLWFISVNTILTRAYYALKNIKAPLYFGVASIIVDIILSYLLLPVLGHGGLALANTLAALANMILLYGYLQKNLQALRIRSVAKTFGKSLVATLIMSVVVLALTAKTSSWAAGSVKGLLFHVGLASSVGAAVYFAVVLFLQIEEGKWLLKRLTKKV